MKRRFPLWPVIVICMLASAGMLNVIVYLAASRTPGELIDAKPYESSMAYERKLGTLRAASELQIEVSLVAAPADAAGVRRIEAAVRSVKSQLPQTITLEALRPSSSSLDTKFELMQEGEGIYAAKVALSPGLWLFRLSGNFSGREVLIERQLVLP